MTPPEVVAAIAALEHVVAMYPDDLPSGLRADANIALTGLKQLAERQKTIWKVLARHGIDDPYKFLVEKERQSAGESVGTEAALSAQLRTSLPEAGTAAPPADHLAASSEGTVSGRNAVPNPAGGESASGTAAPPAEQPESDDEMAASDPNVCEHGWHKSHPQPCPECEEWASKLAEYAIPPSAAALIDLAARRWDRDHLPPREAMAEAIARAVEETWKEAAKFADAEAAALERTSYGTGVLSSAYVDVMKWRKIAAAIRCAHPDDRRKDKG